MASSAREMRAGASAGSGFRAEPGTAKMPHMQVAPLPALCGVYERALAARAAGPDGIRLRGIGLRAAAHH